jgi:hypothetical protein
VYQLLDEPQDTQILGSWQKALEPFSEVVGFTHFGSIFLRNPATQQYLILHPLSYGKNGQDCGVYASVADFETTVLKDPDFVRDFLRPEDHEALVRRLGAPAPYEVYIPCPYPIIGGSGELSTYNKGNVWVFADLAGQTVGAE